MSTGILFLAAFAVFCLMLGALGLIALVIDRYTSGDRS